MKVWKLAFPTLNKVPQIHEEILIQYYTILQIITFLQDRP